MSQHSSTTAIEAIIGYAFANKNTLWLALQAAGSGGAGGVDGNRSMAMIGDAVMKLVLLDDLVAAGISRGIIDLKVQSIVSNDNLAGLCDTFGMTQHINGNRAQQGMKPPKTRAATVEAVLGGVYLDSGDVNAIRTVMENLGMTAYNGTG